MELVNDMGCVESRFSPFRHSVCVSAKKGARLALLGDEAQVEAGFHPFGDSANLDAR
jgi:hypothetical protein